MNTTLFLPSKGSSATWMRLGSLDTRYLYLNARHAMPDHTHTKQRNAHFQLHCIRTIKDESESLNDSVLG